MQDELSARYHAQIVALFEKPMYSLPQSKKEALLLPILETLSQLHRQQCTQYRNIVTQEPKNLPSLADLPYLAVRLFKQLQLQSIEEQAIFRVLQSSGTTSQTPSSIALDKATSARQTKALVKILQQDIGKQRLPMLIVDSPTTARNTHQFSARAAGIQGLAFFGRDHTYALDENMQLNLPAIEAFQAKYANQSVLLFGFTFMVWQYFVQALQSKNVRLSLPQGILLHSGGWKNLVERQVSNETFKEAFNAQTDITQVYNFYGMAEQVGSVFVECTHGHLHAPLLADVIIRDPFSLRELTVGQSGLVQVLSVLPTSYPGHSILTEDLGTLLGIDNCPCGRKGRYFKIQGRLPKTEVRGCSDTHTV